MKRPSETDGNRAQSGTCPDETFAKKYPTLTQYLTDDRWDDGKPRETSALAITIKDGYFQVAVNDKALKQSIYSAGKTLQEALKLAEEGLTTGEAQWRPWKRGK